MSVGGGGGIINGLLDVHGCVGFFERPLVLFRSGRAGSLASSRSTYVSR